LQVDDILPEADQHLGRGLMTDAPVQEGLSRKELGVTPAPHFGDLIAQKNHAINAQSRRPQFGIFAAVASEPTPVTQQTYMSGQLLFQLGNGFGGIRRLGLAHATEAEQRYGQQDLHCLMPKQYRTPS